MAEFIAAVNLLLEHEGGYTPGLVEDPGGETNFGISAHSYPDLNIKSLAREDAIAIYRRDFWLSGYEYLSSQSLANSLLDFGVNAGTSVAVRTLQQSLGKIQSGPVVADGKFGKHTLDAANAVRDQAELLRKFTVGRLVYYAGLGNSHLYFHVWAERALDV